MESIVWTVSTQVGSDGITKVFTSRAGAVIYLTSIIIKALDHGYSISRTEDSYWIITLEFYKDDNLKFVSTIRGQKLLSLKDIDY